MYGNSYYQPRFQSNNGQITQPSYIQPMQPIPPITPVNNQIGLLGKIVDSVDVVKAMDIPLDGSVSYFPLTDGSAIVSKQLQTDGTSKTVVYKPVIEQEIEMPKYVTFEELKREIDNIEIADIDDLKDELKDIKKQLKNLKKSKED